MALHTELEIYRAAYDLLGVAADAIRGMPRDVKPVIGRRINDDCLEVLADIARANRAIDKAPHLEALLERVASAEVLFRLSRDKKFISTGAYANAITLTVSIGKQANGWRKAFLRQLHEGHGPHARAVFNLVVPLPGSLGTDMRLPDTTGPPAGPRAVAPPMKQIRFQWGDVGSTTDGRSTRTTPTTPGTSISATATRTTTTSRMSSGCAPSADWTGTLFALPRQGHADFSLKDLVEAYLDCRQHKRNTGSARAFEQNLEANLCALHDELAAGTYAPGRSICFVITRPRPREVWAAPFRDRIVHHLLYNRIGRRFEAAFISDSCACIPGRGTLYAVRRLEAKIRSITANWARPAFYLKCDLASFFVSIDKRILAAQLERRIPEPWWRELALQVLFADPRAGAEVQSSPERLALVPAGKSLFQQPAHLGLPIGNLSSQFFANVYLDALDQYVKHRLHARYYIRYVDDFILLHESPAWLNAARERIEAFVAERLNVRLNPTKTILQPVERGVDFVGQVVKPWRRTVRRRTFRAACARLSTLPAGDVFASANSYFGMLRQATASHTDRAQLANLARDRGLAVDQWLTKAYR